MKAIVLCARSPLCHSCFRRSFLLVPLVLLLVCFAPCQMARAVSPAPDGGYAGNNTAEGTSALFSLTSGADNTAIGFQALFSNTSGTFNSGEGFRALFSNTTGMFNTATGVQALNSNTIGAQNTATGVNALFSNTTASFNTANGTSALFHNTTGAQNTATGTNALTNNTTGNSNTANGVNTLYRNTTGDSNTAVGNSALRDNIDGAQNTAVGFQALRGGSGSNLTFNTAIGYQALQVATGNANTAVGDLTLQSNSSGFFNVAVGAAAGFSQTTGHNNIYIGQGSFGVAGENNTCYIQEIFGQLSTGGAAVFVNSAGKLGTTTSSKRFKEDIKPMDKASEALFALKPVTFRYKKELEPQPIPQWGLVAEDVEKVNPDLVVRDAEGKVNTVRYDAVYNMLLNEFLKEHKKVQNLEATVAQQQKGMEALTAQLKEQAAHIQKVSAQLATSKSAPKVVENQ